ncbi:hypothetical protein HME9302_00601 [Alteripontixanthobacter maritimus]|uniref:Nudix hydrolase domain-containing protein n=1 Tax=Alteripontixanthobacter maritimus TaxID=2161824 RepID=A0A369Q3E7_9SPHN|nr:NUDIX domain-containing protein [Alteripontixanthobacter maritimus]RDC59413.1 hypothetical protein HME9302_00601 [Alteripontixanthobacter maritimus]
MADIPDDQTVNAAGIPAATVVVFRNAAQPGPPEILMVIRSRQLRFAGGATVFPGGRVDPADYALADNLGHDLDRDEAAHRIAAIRETLEETGLAIGMKEPVSASQASKARAMALSCGALAPVLDAMGWTAQLDTVVPFARWFPKNEKLSRVFDTRFYLHDLGTGAVDLTVDETENTRLFWTTAAGALEAADRGDIDIIYPTRRNLERLAQFPNFSAARAQAEAIPVRTIIPFQTEEHGARWIRIANDAGYPVTGERIDSARRE